MTPPLGEEPSPDDWTVIWGRRIGRSLAVIACIVLAASLIATFLR
ncbi:hypothetical protein [Ancylobacter crimeensis]|nr:hypothetical protein [Ancylobacter crimeensis]